MVKAEQEVNILYIEDNIDSQKLVKRLLNAYGYDVTTKDNGREGLAYVQDHQPDLILVDINMPFIDGYTVTREIRTLDHLKTTPIIAVTANALRGDREKSIEAGCDGYIQKPINIDLFVKEINNFLQIN